MNTKQRLRAIFNPKSIAWLLIFLYIGIKYFLLSEEVITSHELSSALDVGFISLLILTLNDIMNSATSVKSILKKRVQHAMKKGFVIIHWDGLPDHTTVKEIWPNAVLTTSAAYQALPNHSLYAIHKNHLTARIQRKEQDEYCVILDWSNPDPEQWPTAQIPKKEGE
jgi:hypothetical protein